MSQTKTFTWQELASHNTEKDCWVAVRGKIYDVTEFMHRHPGGKDVLLLNAGRDATQIFESYHPMKIITSTIESGNNGSILIYLEKNYMGDLSSTELPSYPEMSEFYKTVKKRIENYFKETKQDPKFSPSILLRSVLLVVALLAFHAISTYISYINMESHNKFLTTLSYLFAALVGVCAALLSLVPVHEASHAAITNRPNLWRAFGAIHDFINGASFYTWCHQHFLGHHFYTNTVSDSTSEDSFSLLPDTWDPDVVTGNPDMRRIKANQKWYRHYEYQHYYAPILYGLLSIKFRISDFNILFFLKKNGAIRVNPLGTWNLSTFFLGKIFYVFYRLVLPIYFTGLQETFWLYLTAEFVLSYYLAFVFQVNHVVSQVSWPVVNTEKNLVEMDWAKSQVETTIDYGHGCSWTHFLSGALNYQSVHHLVPYCSQYFYPQIAPIVQQACQEYGVRYVVLPNFWVAFKEHINYLRSLGHVKQA